MISDFRFLEKGIEYMQNSNRILGNNPKRQLSTVSVTTTRLELELLLKFLSFL